jgi:hypothetical protein
MLPVITLLFIIFISVAESITEVNLQHQTKSVKTVTKTVYRTKTVTASAKLTSAAPRLSTKTVTLTAAGTPGLERLFQISLISGANGCNPVSGKLGNSSAAAWTMLASRGDLTANTCRNAYLALFPGGPLQKATLKLECKGKSSVLQVHSYSDWISKCDKTTLMNSWVFSNGYNCSARPAGVVPDWEIGLTTNVCANKAIDVRADAPLTLEFASVMNPTDNLIRGIGVGNYSNVDQVANNVATLSNGPKVLILKGGALATTVKTPVVFSLEAVAGSASIPWGRAGIIAGEPKVVPVAGVASLGKVGILQSGTWQFKACLQGTTNCALSNPVRLYPEEVTKGVILKQPAEGASFEIFNPQTGTADFGAGQGINATWMDDFGNNGAMAEFFANKPGVVYLNVTCWKAGETVEQGKMVWTERAFWAKTGYVVFSTMGNLKKGIEDAFGKGSLGSSLDGWKCLGDVGLQPDLFAKDSTTKTNVWTFA